MGSVVVVDYDSAWPSTFEEIRASVWPLVSDVANRMEHVGSTAVPGLAAKPVIDLDIVAPPELIPQVITRLEELGYEHRGDLGIPGREAFRPPPGPPKHHLYVCPEGNAALTNHLVLRDHLRASPLDAQAYGGLKKRLAVEFAGDMDGYIQGKTEFILRILQEHGFNKAALRDIGLRNRRGGPPESG